MQAYYMFIPKSEYCQICHYIDTQMVVTPSKTSYTRISLTRKLVQLTLAERSQQICVYFNGVKCLLIRRDLALHRLTRTTSKRAIENPCFKSYDISYLAAQALLAITDGEKFWRSQNRTN